MLKNQKGFTLIEALIALSITSILILATSTSFMKLYDYINLNQTLATIQADLAYIRQFIDNKVTMMFLPPMKKRSIFVAICLQVSALMLLNPLSPYHSIFLVILIKVKPLSSIVVISKNRLSFQSAQEV